ncbi:MAG: enoyl-CoA hydratase/isomerase family protein [Acidimicrobiia bacterium]|nr:enoyl-CoA hydratase/isomerase family protein [Acidimicrobiia bacterium]
MQPSVPGEEALVLVEPVRPHVRVVHLNRAHRLNAMSFELMTELEGAFAAVAADNECRVVVLTGDGRGFCSGLDLEDPGVIPGIDSMPLARIGPVAMAHFSKIVPVMRDVPQPIVAAVNGPAFGGGMCLALGADVRYAGESARFNATGIVNGLCSTELGASYLLPRLIGASRSSELLLTGREIDAAEAERIGLVSGVLPDTDLLEHCIAVAEQMCRYSAYGLQMTKQVIWDNLETTSLRAAIDLEDRTQLLLGNTANLIECVAARREGREPVYTDMPRTDIADAIRATDERSTVPKY